MYLKYNQEGISRKKYIKPEELWVMWKPKSIRETS